MISQNSKQSDNAQSPTLPDQKEDPFLFNQKSLDKFDLKIKGTFSDDNP